MKSRAGTRRWSVYAPLNCPVAYAGGESQELTVDWLGWLCYLNLQQ